MGKQKHSTHRIQLLWRENALSIVLLGLFSFFALAQAIVGHQVHNEERRHHGQSSLSMAKYLGSGHFLEAYFENWESEFLQMGLFVILAAGLRQKGSAESKKLDEEEPVDEDPREKMHDPNAPWPVRRGGMWLMLYEHSLSFAFLALFLFSFVMHAVHGVREVNHQNLHHGEPMISTPEYLASSQFWFESFQNWQSEFVAVFAIVFLTIFLRQRGSAQSKPVAAPHRATGN